MRQRVAGAHRLALVVAALVDVQVDEVARERQHRRRVVDERRAVGQAGGGAETSMTEPLSETGSNVNVPPVADEASRIEVSSTLKTVYVAPQTIPPAGFVTTAAPPLQS